NSDRRLAMTTSTKLFALALAAIAVASPGSVKSANAADGFGRNCPPIGYVITAHGWRHRCVSIFKVDPSRPPKGRPSLGVPGGGGTVLDPSPGRVAQQPMHPIGPMRRR